MHDRICRASCSWNDVRLQYLINRPVHSTIRTGLHALLSLRIQPRWASQQLHLNTRLSLYPNRTTRINVNISTRLAYKCHYPCHVFLSGPLYRTFWSVSVTFEPDFYSWIKRKERYQHRNAPPHLPPKFPWRRIQFEFRMSLSNITSHRFAPDKPLIACSTASESAEPRQKSALPCLHIGGAWGRPMYVSGVLNTIKPVFILSARRLNTRHLSQALSNHGTDLDPYHETVKYTVSFAKYQLSALLQ